MQRIPGSRGWTGRVARGWARLGWVLGLVSLAGGAAMAGAAAGPGWKLEAGSDPGEVRIEGWGGTRLAYVSKPGQHKPYVRELWSRAGKQVLRDGPEDHPHHHGLMLALRVNGVNFWEEREPAGRQRPLDAAEVRIVGDRGSARSGEVRLRQRIGWFPPGETDPGRAWLIEQRTLRLRAAGEGGQVVELDWESAFRVGPAVEEAVVHGPDYHGLGLRLPATFDREASFVNGLGLPLSAEQTYDVRPGPWTAVSGRVEGGGGAVQVVLAAHPGNPGRQASFSMRNPFAYLAATPETGRRPLRFGAGERFTFRYRVQVRDELAAREALSVELAGWTGPGGERGRRH